VPVPCYVRGGRRLPLVGLYGLLVEILKKTSDASAMLQAVASAISTKPVVERGPVFGYAFQMLEGLVAEGGVTASLAPTKPRLGIASPREGDHIRRHTPIETGSRQ